MNQTLVSSTIDGDLLLSCISVIVQISRASKTSRGTHLLQRGVVMHVSGSELLLLHLDLLCLESHCS